MPPWLVLAGAGIIFGAALARRTLRNRPALAPLMCCVAVAALTMVGMLDRFRAVDQSLPDFGRKVDAIVPPGECIELTGTEDRETGAYTGIADVLYYIHREPASVAQRPTRYRIIYSRALPQALAEGEIQGALQAVREPVACGGTIHEERDAAGTDCKSEGRVMKDEGRCAPFITLPSPYLVDELVHRRSPAARGPCARPPGARP